MRTCLSCAPARTSLRACVYVRVFFSRVYLQFTEDGRKVRPLLDDFRDWAKDLSPGQKQKLAFARLFYHRPAFVVLDECTNGISPDVEQVRHERLFCFELSLLGV